MSSPLFPAVGPDGRLLDKHLPGRLSETDLNATYVLLEDYVPGGTSTPSGPESAGAVDLAKFSYRARTATWSDPDGWTIQTLADDGRTIIGSNGTDIGISTDDGASWSAVHTFTQTVRGVLLLGDGEVLVSAASDGQRGVLMRSSGWQPSPSGATWTQVRQTPSGVFGVYPYSRYTGLVRGAGSHVYAADYGAKTNTRATADLGAVRLLHSADHGASWREIFRLDTWLTGRGIDPMADGYHLHGVCWDPYWGRLWLSFGDRYTASGETGVLFTDNPTATTPTWDVGYLGSTNPVGAGSNGQGVGMVACRDALVILPDGVPAAIFRLPRIGYREHGPLEIVYRVTKADGTDTTSAAAIGGQPFQAAYPGAPVLLPIGHQVGNQGNLSRIVATADGTRFHELYRDEDGTVATFGGTSSGIIGPTSTGKIVATSLQDGRYSGPRSTLTLPGYFGAVAAGTPAVAPTTAPTLTAGAATSSTQPLSWTAVADATGYTVQYKKTGDSTWLLAGTPTGLSLTVTDLDADTGYDYRVAGRNEGGTGPWSDSVSATTGSAPTATVIWADTFDRANGVVSTTEVGGKTYETAVGAGVTAEIESNKLRFRFTGSVSGQQFIIVDGGQADGVFTVQNASIDGTANTEHVGGIAMRWVDASNYIDLSYSISPTNPVYRVRRIVGGSVAGVTELGVNHDDTDRIVVIDEAGVITVLINGVQRFSAAVAEHATATKKGVRSQYSGNRAAWDSLEFKTLA